MSERSRPLPSKTFLRQPDIMAFIIPTQPVPSQTVACIVGQQSCTINVRQAAQGMFVDLYVNNAPIILSVMAYNANRIVRDAYLGFIGDIAIYDLAGNADPYYSGMGSRFQLVYIPASELP